MTAADIIAAHTEWDNTGGMCICENELWSGEHILAVLKAAGYEVVELPEPTRHTDNTAQWDGMYWSVIRNVGVVISDVAHLQSFDPDEARSLAAALLAAANAAEEAK